MDIKLAPSLARADMLNFEAEIHKLEEAHVDLIHLDITDATYSDTILLSPEILPAIHKITDIPLDIHITVSEPERILPVVLPYCHGDYVCIQVETAEEICKLLKAIKSAGGIPAVAINPCTPLCMPEELTPYVGMVNLIVRSIGYSTLNLNEHILNKIARTRKILNENGNPDAEIEVDGSIDYQDARLTTARGANILVLGTKVVFRPGYTYTENCEELRVSLQQ